MLCRKDPQLVLLYKLYFSKYVCTKLTGVTRKHVAVYTAFMLTGRIHTYCTCYTKTIYATVRIFKFSPTSLRILCRPSVATRTPVLVLMLSVR